MNVKLNLRFRRFNSHSERIDSGYYDGLTPRKTANIEINRNDDCLEQIMTAYHELTHAMFDLVSKYKFDKKHLKILPNDPDLPKQWFQKYDLKEEIICREVEKAVKRVFKKNIPNEFYVKFFEQNKDFINPKLRAHINKKQRKPK